MRKLLLLGCLSLERKICMLLLPLGEGGGSDNGSARGTLEEAAEEATDTMLLTLTSLSEVLLLMVLPNAALTPSSTLTAPPLK